jgi:NAD(P)-dependent dehydrogenase (short-subunit alcohol dehydrogenase family)
MPNKLIIDLSTGEYKVEQLTQDEEADALAREAAEEALEAPRRAILAADNSAKEYAKADAVIQYLVNHTPAECADYVQANVTDLASAKQFLKKVAMALSVLARSELR